MGAVRMRAEKAAALKRNCFRDCFCFAKLGRVRCVCDEAFDVLHGIAFALQHHALRPRARADRLHGMRPCSVIPFSAILCPVDEPRSVLRTTKGAIVHLGVQVLRLLARQGCEKRRFPQQMIHPKAHPQLLGKHPSAAPFSEVRPRSPDKPTLALTFALTFALEVALLKATCRIVGHI
eukprot:scaffold43552_cov75-Phaeocystis_antarctica.AAC.1